MQENEFEKTIREKMDQLRLVPNDEVWNKVSEKIRKDKKKRRFLFLLLSLIFLGGITGFYFLNNSNSTSHLSAAKENTSATTKTFQKNTELLPNQEIAKANPLRDQNHDEQKGISENEPTSKKAINHTERPVAVNAKRENHTLENKPVAIAKRAIEEKSKVKRTNSGRITKDTIVNTNEHAAQPHSDSLIQSATQPRGERNKSEQQNTPPFDSLKLTPKDLKKVDVSKDTASHLLANTKSSPKPKLQPKKNWKIGVTILGGVSDNLGSSPSGGSLNYASPNSNTSSPGPSNALISKLSYNSSLSYSIGVFASKSFSKKIGFSAGINYHFLSAISPAGAKISTSQTIYDASLQSSAFVNQVYSSGQSVDFKNKYELVELPLNILFQLNRNENKKLLLTTGFTPAYLFNSRALYASTSQNLYYETNEQFKKVLLLMQLGVQISVINSPWFEITTGPQIQYGLNNMAKTATGTSQHLSSALLKVNILFK